MITRKNLAVLITAFSLCASFFSPVMAASAATPTALSVPKNVKVTPVSTTSVKVTFSRVQRTNSYKIYLYKANGKTLARKPIVNFKPGRKITGLTKGAKYFISVGAISRSVRFKNSPLSKKIKFTAGPAPTPTPTPVATPTATPTPVATPTATPTPTASPTPTPTASPTPTPTPKPTRTPDTTPPVLSSETVTAVSTTSATLNFTTGARGTYYYLVYTAVTGAPNASTIIAQGSVGGPIIALGSAAATLGSNTAPITGLSAGTTYTAYLVIRDAALNTSEISTITFLTTASTPAASTDARLSALSLSSGSLTPVFDSATAAYTQSVANGVDSITAIATVNESHATLTINGASVASTVASSNISIAAGTTETITIVVTAQDGTTLDTYTVAVSRAAITPAPDTLAPVLSSESATAITETSTVLSFTTSETGTAYYLVYVSATAAPDSATIIAQGSIGGSIIALGSSAAAVGLNTASITGLSANTSYKAYLVVQDAALNTSIISTISFKTATAVTGPCYVTNETGTVITDGHSCGGALVIPRTITEIAAGAFASMASSLNYLTFETGSVLTTIGADAFFQDSGINQPLIIPASVRFIGERAFESMGINPLTFEAGSNLETISARAFYGDQYITSLTIPANVKFIGSDAFGYTPLLACVINLSTADLTGTGLPALCTAPDTIAPVLSSESATAITETSTVLSFTTSETGTAYYLVYDSATAAPVTATIIAHTGGVASGLESVTVGSKTISITGLTANTAYKAYLVVQDAALNTSIISTISFVTSAVSGPPAAPCYVLEGTVITDGSACTGALTIPRTVTQLGISAFESSTITSLSFESGSALETISARAFYQLALQGSLQIPASVKTIGESAFQRTNLTSLSFETGSVIELVDLYAFVHSFDLTGPITIPASLREVRDYAFYNTRFTCVRNLSGTNVSGVKGLGGVPACAPWTFVSTSTPTIVASGSSTSLETATVGIMLSAYNYETTTPSGAAFTFQWESSTVLDGSYSAIEGATYETFTATSDLLGNFLRVKVKANAVGYTETSTASVGLPVSEAVVSTCYLVVGTVLTSGSSCVGTVIISKSITAIADWAFGNNVAITSLAFESGTALTTIGSCSFYGDVNLGETLTIPASVETISSQAFRFAAFTSISFESGTSLARIDDSAFAENSHFTGSLTIPASVQVIGVSAFDFTTISSLNFETGSALQSIEANAFRSIPTLQGSLRIPATVKSIGFAAFWGSGIDSLTFGAGSLLETISPAAFSSSRTLTGSLVIPKSVTVIGGDAFLNTSITCVTNLSSASLTGTGLEALPACAATPSALPKVESITAPSGPKQGGTNVIISGTGFSDTGTVSFGGETATNVVFIDSTTISATTPVHALGESADVVVTNVDGQSDTLTAGFMYYCDGESSTTCAVGERGPGGGIVYYVDANGFTCGATLANTCQYLEVAPSGWNNAGTPQDDPIRTWAQDSPVDYQRTLVNNASSPEMATATSIGWGYRNTRAIILQGNTNAATSAAALADSYTVTNSGVVYEDWYLPSKDELNQMCKWQRGVAWTSDATVCTGGTINTGSGASGFVDYFYWSSSESMEARAWYQSFRFGSQDFTITKEYTYYVRPIRAFGPTSLSFASTSTPTIVASGSTTALDALTVGVVLSAFGYETTTPAADSYTFQWESSTAVDGTYLQISGAINETFTPTSDLVGNFVRVVVKVGATGYTETSTPSVGVTVYAPPAYAIGATGPGGGIVYYYSAPGFACGATLADTCNYLEVAPSGWDNAGTPQDDPTRGWAIDSYINTAVGTGGGDTSTATALGWGFRNSLAIIAQGNSDTLTVAAALARSYSGGQRSDWFLPTLDELTALYNFDTTAMVGGLIAGNEQYYWSSSEYSSFQGWEFAFSVGGGNVPPKDTLRYVRPIRAFGKPCYLVNESATITDGSACSGPLFIPSVIHQIGASAFVGSSITSLTFGANSSLQYIGNSAFEGISTLGETLTIPASVLSIGVGAFRFTNISALTFETGSSLATIVGMAFMGVQTLNGTLTIPASVTEIGAGAFTGTNLTSLTFETGSALTAIGFDAFSNVETLTGELKLPASVTDIGAGAFTGTNFTCLTYLGLASLNGTGLEALPACVTTPSAAPTIASITGPSGHKQGGTSVTISGTGFYESATVSIGGTLAETVTVTDSSTITAFSPSHSYGELVDVVVTNSDNQSDTLTAGFMYYCDGESSTTCAVGERGPGGGIVYYVDANGFTCGETLGTTCKYLEVAPSGWDNAGTPQDDPSLLWTVAAYQSVNVIGIADDRPTAINNAAGIGLGLQNSNYIVGQSGVCGTGVPSDCSFAAGAARLYTGGSLNDWYLPTTAELNLLCQWNRGVTQDVTKICSGGTINSGTGASSEALVNSNYWSSSEFDDNWAWPQSFDTGLQEKDGKSNYRDLPKVRPIRAFGSAQQISACYVVDGTTIIDGSLCTGPLTIANTITSIGAGAFAGNFEITSLNFEAGSLLETISAQAFANATSLTGTLTIPASVTAIESQAFYGDSFTSLVFETPTALEIIGDNAFRYNSLLTGTLIIPRSVRILDLAAFEFTAITSLNFETSSALETIGESAFHGTPNLAGTVTIPKSVKSIGTYAFMESGISSLVFEVDSALETISVQAFDQNPTLVGSLTIPASVKTIGDYAFRSAAITSLIFETGSALEYINYGAFEFIPTLSGTLTIPDKVISIGREAFYGSGISTLNFETGSALEIIDYSSFAYNSLLGGALTIPASVKTIGHTAFYSTAITSLTFESASILENIIDFAFANSNSLTGSLTIPESVTSIGEGAFRGTNLTCVINKSSTFTNLALAELTTDACNTLSSASKIKGVTLASLGTPFTDTATALSDFGSINPGSVTLTWDQANFVFVFNESSTIPTESLTAIVAIDSALSDVHIAKYDSSTVDFSDFESRSYTDSETISDGDIFIVRVSAIDTTLLPNYYVIRASVDAPATQSSSCYVVDGTTIIDGSACSGALFIPKTIKAIGQYAFYLNKSITSLTFETESTLENIGDYAFSESTLGESLTIPASVTFIGDSAFNLTYLTELVFESSSQLVTITDGAFYGITTLTGPIIIPATVSDIKSYAFTNSAISSLTFESGSVLKTIGEHAFRGVNSLTGSLIIPTGVTYIGGSAFQYTSITCVINNSATFRDLAIAFLPANACNTLSPVSKIKGVTITSLGTPSEITDPWGATDPNFRFGSISLTWEQANDLSGALESATVFMAVESETADVSLVKSRLDGPNFIQSLAEFENLYYFDTETVSDGDIFIVRVRAPDPANPSNKISKWYSLSVTVEANPFPAPVFTLSASTESVSRLDVITGFTPITSDSSILRYEISPTPVAGLNFDTTTGILSGTPTQNVETATYTISAINERNSSTATFILTVNGISCDGTTFDCAVGDRGPGNGIIFYVQAAGTFAEQGTDCNSACKYLEVAPAGWYGSGTPSLTLFDPSLQWLNASINDFQDTSADYQSGFAYEQSNWAFGQGFYNTFLISDVGLTSEASDTVLAYGGTDGSTGQWFIPSMNELNELCKYARGQVTGVLTVQCASSGKLKDFPSELGGFDPGHGYWSSSQINSGMVWYFDFNSGGYSGSGIMGGGNIRPIRAF